MIECAVAVLGQQPGHCIRLEEPIQLHAEPRALRRSYLEAIERFLADVRKTCASAGVDYVLMNTKEPLDAVLGSYLTFRQKIRRTARTL